MRFLLATLKTLTNSKKLFWKAALNFCPVSLVDFSSVLYIHSRLSEQFSWSRAGYLTTFGDTGGYQKAGTSSLKRVTGRNFTISRGKQKLYFDFLHKKTTKIVKTRSSHSKITVSIFRAFKKIFISWHCPFKVILYLIFKKILKDTIRIPMLWVRGWGG